MAAANDELVAGHLAADHALAELDHSADADDAGNDASGSPVGTATGLMTGARPNRKPTPYRSSARRILIGACCT
jgi:hypothetical protein